MKKWIAVALVLSALAVAYVTRSSNDQPTPEMVAAASDSSDSSANSNSAPSVRAAAGQAGMGGGHDVAREIKKPADVELPDWMIHPELAQQQAQQQAEPQGNVGPTLEALSAKRSAKVSPAEAQLLDFYGDVVRTFEENPTDCVQLATTLEKQVADSGAVNTALAQSRASLDEAGRAQAQTQLEQEAEAELALLRQALRVGIARCSSEPRVFGAIRTLAAIGRTP